MDWIGELCMLFFISLLMCCVGHLGSLIGIKKEGDVFVDTKIGDLYIPTIVEDFKDFKKTIQLLYTWKVYLR